MKKEQVGQMVNLKNDKIDKMAVIHEQIDKIAIWLNSQLEEMASCTMTCWRNASWQKASWLNGKLEKHHFNEMVSWWICDLMKWQIDETRRLWSEK